MQGGVRKRGKTWSYYFDLGKIDGKRKKKENGGFRTKKEAEQAEVDAMAVRPSFSIFKIGFPSNSLTDT